MEPMVVVNGFAFCKKHGDEYCHRCTYDHRFTNNYQIQDEPAIADILEDGVYDLEGRDSINVYRLGAVVVGSGEECKCTKHDRKDCSACFNWVEYIKKEAKEAEDREKWLKKRERYYRNRDD